MKLVKREMAFFRTFKWLIWNKLFHYWTLSVKNFIPPRNIAYIYFIICIHDGRNLFWSPKLAFYAMQNESLISFQPKYFFKMVWYTVKKCYLRPLYFAQKCSQDARNAVSETQISRGSCPRSPLRKCVVTLSWGSMGPFPPERARPLNGTQYKPTTWPLLTKFLHVILFIMDNCKMVSII